MDNQVFSLTVAYILLDVFSVCESRANLTYIPPIKDGYEAAVIFIPEHDINGTAYRPLAELLQKQSPLSLWCVLFEGFDVGVSPDDELSRTFPNITMELRSKGMKNNVIFMAGHGTGGVIIASFLQNNYMLVNGTLLLGSKVPGDLDQKDYLVPTYTISGDMDGIVRITSMLHMYENSQLSDDYRTPFIVLSGVNHSQFASGEMPDFIKENDFPSTMNDSAAKNLIVHVCNIIMITILRQPESELAMANNETKTYLEQSKTILQPLIDIQKLDQDEKAMSEWSTQAQIALLGIKSANITVNNTLVDKFKLYFNDPSINLLNGSLSAATWSNVNMPKVKKYDYDYYGPVSPVQIQTKMVSKATVKRLLPIETFNDISMTCRDLNKLAYYHAVSRVPLHIMARFHERRKRIYFYEDSVTNFDLDWMLAQLQTQNFTNGLHITSTRLETDRINDSNSHMNISGVPTCPILLVRSVEGRYAAKLRNKWGNHLLAACYHGSKM